MKDSKQSEFLLNPDPDNTRNIEDVHISAVIVTYNEAQYLPECISRLDFCDDIIVVDIGCTDNSVEVARENGAKVLEHPWVPFAEKAWEDACRHTNNDWIVFVSPDLYLPENMGVRIKSMIARYDNTGLGAVYLPLATGFGGKVLRYGQKGGTRVYRALAHRERNHFKGYVHHRGDVLKEGYFSLCLLRQKNEAIFHDWVDGYMDMVDKARRYLPFEAESRLGVGRHFSWKSMFREIARSLKRDLVKKAFREWPAVQVMLFQLWYYWKANMALRKEEKRLLRGNNV
ncbi:MAG: glycosyltransferase [Anaerolineales bacterium]|nr:glycosyltransferase [Anaerolineales bacterium]